MKSAMHKLYDNLEKIYGSKKTELEKSRLAIKTINEFLYTTSDELGETFVLDQNYKYFSEFHKFWHSNYKEILDLKIDDFKPEYMGKMDFYLEALDRDVKKPKENPSVGMILCKNADTDVVEYSLSKSLSQTMIAEYKTKLIDKDILQKRLAELYDIAEEEVKNSQQD